MGRIQGWPATLSEPGLLDAPLVLRPPRFSDGPVLRDVRVANESWLSQWEPSDPDAPRLPETVPAAPARSRLRQSALWPYLPVARMRWEALSEAAFSWTVCYDGQVTGQLTVWAVAWGSSRSAQLGYWVDRTYAGRGIIPTALALVADHCFQVMRLHRLEAGIAPENTASRRVVEKLGFREEGTRVRQVHINGSWRDHVYYAITAEEAATGLLRRWRSSLAAAPPAADQRRA